MSAPIDDEPVAYDVSVVVPTHNREQLLKKTLQSLLAQHGGAVRYEILVVDNNSNDDTRTVVDEVSRAHPFVRYLFEARPGVSYARNAGIAVARAPIVAFIDDDVEASPTWVASIAAAFTAHPEVDCLGGPIAPRWAAPPPPWLTSMFWAAVAIQTRKGETPYIDADHATPCLMTANFACRRQALLDVGGFAVDFLRDEDRELQLRLWAAGKRGLFVENVTVVTEVPRDRLTKAYHREFYARVGGSHARMRYLDRIDADGRLLCEMPARATILGTPAFIYRRLFDHAGRLLWALATLQWNRAFYHETRLRYYVNYVRARQHADGRSLLTLPRDVARVVAGRFRRTMRRRADPTFQNRESALPGRSIRT